MTALRNHKTFSAERQILGNNGSVVPRPAAGALRDSEDAEEILDAIDDLKHQLLTALGHLPAAEAVPEPELEDEQETKEQELALVKNEIRALSLAIEQTKEEVASLYRTVSASARVEAVQHDLDAVVAATEDATGRILECSESLDQAALSIKDVSDNPFIVQVCEDMATTITQIFEACNFQDLTGQRLTKVVNTLKFIEERLNRIIDIWGREAMDAIEVEAAPTGPDNLNRVIEEMPEERVQISQDEIDKMFD